MIKLKPLEYSSFEYVTLILKSLFEYPIFQNKPNDDRNRNQTMPNKTMNNASSHSNDEITKRKT